MDDINILRQQQQQIEKWEDKRRKKDTKTWKKNKNKKGDREGLKNVDLVT